jgi:hypothetical protein
VGSPTSERQERERRSPAIVRVLALQMVAEMAAPLN